MLKIKSVSKMIRLPLVIAIVLVASHAHAFEELGKVELAPAENPGPDVVGVERHFLKNGKPYWYKLNTVEDGVHTGIDSTGCKFSGLDETWGPSLKWRDCDGNGGSHKITKRKGDTWPLKLKRKFSFNFTGSSTKGDTWKGQRKCKVKSAVKVSVPAGEYDTYKLVCSSPWDVKTYWYSPDLKFSVAIKRSHKKDKSRNYTMEFVR